MQKESHKRRCFVPEYANPTDVPPISITAMCTIRNIYYWKRLTMLDNLLKAEHTIIMLYRQNVASTCIH